MHLCVHPGLDHLEKLMSAPVFIIGYMACGKTTFGRALAAALGRQFIDLDFYIEQRFRRSIRDMFAAEGEETFRRREAAMLREVGEFDDVVIACGGGTPCFHDNMDYLLGRGNVVFLEASVGRIMQRLMQNNARRPLMAGKSENEMRKAVEQGMASRMQHYSRANIKFNSDSLEDRRQISETVAAFIATHM